MRFFLGGNNRSANAPIITDDSCTIYRLTHWLSLPLNMLSNLNLSNLETILAETTRSS